MSYSTYFKTCVFFQTFQMEIRLVQFFEFLIMILLILVSVSIYTFENLGFAAFASVNVLKFKYLFSTGACGWRRQRRHRLPAAPPEQPDLTSGCGQGSLLPVPGHSAAAVKRFGGKVPSVSLRLGVIVQLTFATRDTDEQRCQPE